MFNMIPSGSHDNHMMKRGDSFDRMFDSFLTHPFAMLQNFGTPFESFKVDVKDTGAGYELAAELPGLKKEDISLDYRDNYLTISAEHKEEKQEGEAGSKYLCRERSYGSIRRSFYFDNIDKTAIEAKFNDGVLHVALPKAARSAEDQPINIQ